MLRPALRFAKRSYSLKSSGPAALTDALSRGAPIDIHPEVQDALAHHKPVVALETTIVTHGMPYPVNLKTARSVEKIVRENGSIPATIGIIEGRIKVGLESNELERLANVSENSSTVKVSRRDIGPVISLKRDGGTTCSTTLIFASLAGIKVFATGGLGGVHRGGESSMDVSADLQELTRCPVGLVSAGVKSILDIGRTLEYLETLGVPVVSYGRSDDFPAFYSRESGFKSPWRVDDPISAARVLYSQHQLGMSNGAIFAVPIPEEYEAVGKKLQASVEQALKEAEEIGVNKWGKEATPWLLKRVGELTQGKSLASNIALIENTARVGGQIAVAYAKLAREQEASGSDSSPTRNSAQAFQPAPEGATIRPEDVTKEKASLPAGKVVVIGSAAIDVTAQATTSDVSLGSHSTVPGSVSMTLGGVGRNVAEAAHRILAGSSADLAHATVLVSPVGKDSFGRLLMDETARLGMRTDGISATETGRSAVCNMVLDGSGGLTGGVADMDIIHSFDGDLAIRALEKHKPRIVAVDANLSENTLNAVMDYCTRNSIDVFFEPTSVVKSARIIPAIASCFSRPELMHSPIAYASPNLLELAQIYQAARMEPLELTSHERWWKVIDSISIGSSFRMELDHLARRDACDKQPVKGTLSFLVDKGIAQMAVHLLPVFQHLIIKCGNLGIIAAFRASSASAWVQERSNISLRRVVAHGKSGEVVVLKHYPALLLGSEDIINVTGAGDSLVGSVLASLVQAPQAFEDPVLLDRMVDRAQRAAVLTLKSTLAVSPDLSALSDSLQR